MAVDRQTVLTSANPGGDHWTTTSVAQWLYGVDCPSATLCAADGSGGALLTSTDPASGVRTVTTIDNGRPLNAISRASTSLCVAVDQNGHAVVSTNPAGGAATWQPELIDGDPCADTTPCSIESIETPDSTGMHTVDSAKLSGSGPRSSPESR